MFLLSGGLSCVGYTRKKKFISKDIRAMNIRTLEWRKGAVRIIDQTKLPLRLEYIDITEIASLWKAIRTLQVRGAPALGAAAALGVYLGMKDFKGGKPKDFLRALDRVLHYLASSRPTARNLFWGLERAKRAAVVNKNKPVSRIKQLLLAEALKIIEEDRSCCRLMGKYGAKLIKDGDTVLTICNAGALATIDYGTALGVLYAAKAQGKRFKVFSLETRPLLQGSRLTAWELIRKHIDVTLITDSTAASLMQQGKVSRVICGADRITAAGDAANKIGTLSLAVLAKYHRLPFYVAAPLSTFDLRIKRGEDICIEERPAREITEVNFKRKAAPIGAKVFNPAFDVTPHKLISAIITERGIITAPYKPKIERLI
jgi:methylthioribose-1-phosphate isomerase